MKRSLAAAGVMCLAVRWLLAAEPVPALPETRRHGQPDDITVSDPTARAALHAYATDVARADEAYRVAMNTAAARLAERLRVAADAADADGRGGEAEKVRRMIGYVESAIDAGKRIRINIRPTPRATTTPATTRPTKPANGA